MHRCIKKFWTGSHLCQVYAAFLTLVAVHSSLRFLKRLPCPRLPLQSSLSLALLCPSYHTLPKSLAACMEPSMRQEPYQSNQHTSLQTRWHAIACNLHAMNAKLQLPAHCVGHVADGLAPHLAMHTVHSSLALCESCSWHAGLYLPCIRQTVAHAAVATAWPWLYPCLSAVLDRHVMCFWHADRCVYAILSPATSIMASVGAAHAGRASDCSGA